MIKQYSNSDFIIIRFNTHNKNNTIMCNYSIKIYEMKVDLIEMFSHKSIDDWMSDYPFQAIEYGLAYLEKRYHIMFRIHWDMPTIYIPKSLYGISDWVIDELSDIPYKILKKAPIQDIKDK